MNKYCGLAFVVMPIVVVAIGYASLLLNDGDLRRYQDDTSAE